MVTGAPRDRAASTAHLASGSPGENAQRGPAAEQSLKNCSNVAASAVATPCLVSSGTVAPCEPCPLTLPSKSTKPSNTIARTRPGKRLA